MTGREQALRLVRRARRGLEAARLLRAASRGALAGGAAGLAVALAAKAVPGALAAALPWALLGAGALGGLVAALLRPPIGVAAAALFLDRRLGTAERFATVATRPPDPLVDRVAEELASLRRLPRLPLPREAALVPMALFLLFAAGLLPEARAGGAERAPAFAVAVAPGGEGAPAEAEALPLERLARGEPLAPREAEALREAIERGLRRPEERRAALLSLDRAARGEGEAAAEVAEALSGRGRRGAALLPTAYPEAEEFVRAYRRALEEGRE